MALTLVPESLAAEGYAFHFKGANEGEECQDCPYKALCFRIEPGHYTVSGVRDVTHPCRLHDNGRVRVVEVEATPWTTSLETKHLRGTAATWNAVPCGMPECPSYGFCHPVGVAAGQRHSIDADQGEMDCPAGFDLHRVQLRRL